MKDVSRKDINVLIFKQMKNRLSDLTLSEHRLIGCLFVDHIDGSE